jgi:hypothetical protein
VDREQTSTDEAGVDGDAKDHAKSVLDQLHRTRRTVHCESSPNTVGMSSDTVGWIGTAHCNTG